MHLTRPAPPARNRRHHKLRALVIAHTSHTVGIWFWKRSYPSLQVRIVDEDYKELFGILHRETRNEHGDYVSLPAQEVEIGYRSKRERDSFAIGEEVELLFSTTGVLDQWFSGSVPVQWDGLQKKQTLPA